jgi:hypothetical protein
VERHDCIIGQSVVTSKETNPVQTPTEFLPLSHYFKGVSNNSTRRCKIILRNNVRYTYCVAIYPWRASNTAVSGWCYRTKSVRTVKISTSRFWLKIWDIFVRCLFHVQYSSSSVRYIPHSSVTMQFIVSHFYVFNTVNGTGIRFGYWYCTLIFGNWRGVVLAK